MPRRACFELQLAPRAPSAVAAPSPASMPCQHRVDAKAFTGRGAHRRLREARQRVDSLHREMEQLARLSLTLPGRVMYLCVHRRTRTGQATLRWRQAGALAPHLPWPQVSKLLLACPPALADWYRAMNAAVRRLNGAEKQARAAWRVARFELACNQAELDVG
jgi:hypothetical protein